MAIMFTVSLLGQLGEPNNCFSSDVLKIVDLTEIII
jgi:hypothetical protein